MALTFKADETDLDWLVEQVNSALTSGRVTDEVKELTVGLKDANPVASQLIGQLAECQLAGASQRIGPVGFATILVGLMQRIVDKNRGV